MHFHKSLRLISNKTAITEGFLLLLDNLIEAHVKPFCIIILLSINFAFLCFFLPATQRGICSGTKEMPTRKVLLSAEVLKWSFSVTTLLSSFWILNKRPPLRDRKCHLSH